MLDAVCDLKEWFVSLLHHLHIRLTIDGAVVAFVGWLVEKANAIYVVGGLVLLGLRIFCGVVYAYRYFREKPETR